MNFLFLASQTCPTGYRSTDCYNSCTEDTCANYRTDPNKTRICTTDCQPGPRCVCAQGLYRDDYNVCVNPTQCNAPFITTTTSPPVVTASPQPPVITASPQPVCCLPNYKPALCYNSCSEKTCANLKRDESGPVFCTLECQISGGPNGNCVCDGDMYRNDCNQCVPKDQCNATCTKPQPTFCTGDFETVYGCLDPLEARVCPGIGCSSPRDVFLKFVSQLNSTGLCVLNTCDCQNGYLRNECGKCVLPQECGLPCSDVECPQNEILISTPCKRKRRCHKKKYCKNGKRCKKSRRNGKKCRKSCKNGRKCKKSCRRSKKCKKSKSGRRECRQPCKREVRFKNECVCKTGFARNNCGTCVPVEQASLNVPCVCTNPCLFDPDREWQCFNDCNKRTCDNLNSLPYKLCIIDCLYGCDCSATKDLWFNGTACVHRSLCPAPTSTISPILLK